MPAGDQPVSSVRLANGLTLPYVEQGDRTGLPVVLLHAVADSWRSFEHVLPHLPRSIHALAVTQRGHGDADRPASGYCVEDFAADLEAFLDAVGLDAAVIAASSSAGLAAQRFAADHPRRTLGLAFIGSPRSLRDKPAAAAFLDVVRELSDPVDPAFVREFVAAAVAGPVPAPFVKTLVAESMKLPAHVWRATVAGLLDAVPASETSTITAPAVILWGDRDEFLPRSDQEALAAAMPGARLMIYEGSGHAVHWEQPERVALDLVAFAKRVLRDAPPR